MEVGAGQSRGLVKERERKIVRHLETPELFYV